MVCGSGDVVLAHTVLIGATLNSYWFELLEKSTAVLVRPSSIVEEMCKKALAPEAIALTSISDFSGI